MILSQATDEQKIIYWLVYQALGDTSGKESIKRNVNSGLIGPFADAIRYLGEIGLATITCDSEGTRWVEAKLNDPFAT